MLGTSLRVFIQFHSYWFLGVQLGLGPVPLLRKLVRAPLCFSIEGVTLELGSVSFFKCPGEGCVI